MSPHAPAPEVHHPLPPADPPRRFFRVVIREIVTVRYEVEAPTEEDARRAVLDGDLDVVWELEREVDDQEVIWSAPEPRPLLRMDAFHRDMAQSDSDSDSEPER